MFVFEMFEPLLIMYLRRASARPCLCLSVRALAGSYFFFRNESRWGESVSIPPPPPIPLVLIAG